SSVESAKLRVYVSSVGADPTRVVSVYGLSNTTWAESTITWNNQPAETGTLIGNYTVNNINGRWYELDVTAYINSQLAANKKIVSFRLINQGTTSSANNVSFNSREAASNRPELLLNQEPNNNIQNTEEVFSNEDINTVILPSEALKVKAWPNPSTSAFKVHVEGPSKEIVYYKVYNIAQQLVKEAKTDAHDQLNFGDELVPGMYLIEIKQGTQRNVVKVIKL
ncbi:DUF7594 domain-containing protein, partial [Pedobacter borealis]|uniref:CBM96 family carbohydrate-binding protein n=1 Tax=Pedobacter borealis TaxID=475254 RepID=UPI0004934A07